MPFSSDSRSLSRSLSTDIDDHKFERARPPGQTTQVQHQQRGTVCELTTKHVYSTLFADENSAKTRESDQNNVAQVTFSRCFRLQIAYSAKLMNNGFSAHLHFICSPRTLRVLHLPKELSLLCCLASKPQAPTMHAGACVHKNR